MTLITEARLRKQKLSGLPNPFYIDEGNKITPAAYDYLRDNQIEVIYASEKKHMRNEKEKMESFEIPVGISNRHIHLCKDHVDVLFGPEYELTPWKELSQPGQYAAKETVTIIGTKGHLHHVRILGPERPETQIEISKMDGFTLGVHPPIRLSGDIDDTPGITIVGPRGHVVLDKGVIIAKMHIHMSPDDAKQFNVTEDDTLMLQATSDRPIIYPEVIVRINERFSLDCHVDMDEGNAANIRTGDNLSVIGKNGKFFG